MRETPSDLGATMSSVYQSGDGATLIKKTSRVEEPRLNHKAFFFFFLPVAPPWCSKRIPKTWWTKVEGEMLLVDEL